MGQIVVLLVLCYFVAPMWLQKNTTTMSPPTTVTQATTFSMTTGHPTPPDVKYVNVTHRTEKTLTFQWNAVDNNPSYNYILRYNNCSNNINGSNSSVTHTVTNLTSGTEYTFYLYTVNGGTLSTGLNFTDVTSPCAVTNVSVTFRNETALTFKWIKVNNNSNYSYMLTYGNQSISINETKADSEVTCTVEGLNPGTEYTFTLYTVFKEVRSTGYHFSDVTSPSPVNIVSVTFRNETALTLKWIKINNNSNYSYMLIYGNQSISISVKEADSAVTCTVNGLNPGTEYTFTLFTVFKEVRSTGYHFSDVTSPSPVNIVSVMFRNETALTLKWNKVNNNSNYSYMLIYGNQSISIKETKADSAVTWTVNGLNPGTEYTFTLFTVFKKVLSTGYHFSDVTIPHTVTGLDCQYSSGGYGLILVWGPANGGRTAVKVTMGSGIYQSTEDRLNINGLLPAQWYTLTVVAISLTVQSSPVSITCQTDARGVIAGVVTFLLLAILIICIGILVWHHKRSRKLNKSESSNETELSRNKYKPIHVKNFPVHFKSMSRDEERGFVEEYEDLGNVGTDQSCTAATLPENKSKNRFVNVLAYDSSRVKLAAQSGSDSDYINANYIHGYGKKNKQYIAAQGPLPSTVNDFWRMVWEQKSSAIVMLTSCTEAGKIKCEHYWPTDNKPCLYGNLQVSVQSEQIERSWIRREFIIRNESVSEEHPVTHFHFTAWPDHGVPVGTEELIQFRWLVRQHIETFPFRGATVVHCSAGVGRTGTLIALDILLQQMEKEQVVSVADCVCRMRLSRPLMVQTLTQYVLLHQCIMDSLPKKDTVSEPIYENSDMIYVNALAIKENTAANTGV